MAVGKKKKEEQAKAEELVPYKCYSCHKYDGTFGIQKEEHTHVCKMCKELPTEIVPIEHHVAEYFAHAGHYGEEALPCERCKQERDTCICTDNPLRRKHVAAN